MPLHLAWRFLRLVGHTLAAMVAGHPRCAVFARHRAQHTQRQRYGWATVLEDRAGRLRTVSSRLVVIATGASQPVERLANERVGLVERCGHKLLQSGDVFVAGGLDACSRKIVGWAADDSMPTALVARAFERAVATQRPSHGLLRHSDRGSRYASDAYRALLFAPTAWSRA